MTLTLALRSTAARHCERLGLLDVSNRFGLVRPKDVVAEAVFCSGQQVEGLVHRNSLGLIDTVFRSGWPSHEGRYWSAVIVDMKFGDDERFGLQVIRSVHQIAPDVPILVVSSLNQLDLQADETLRRAAERVGAQDFLAAPGVSGDAEPAYHSTPQNLRRRLNDIGLIPDPDQIVVGTSLALCRTLLAVRQNIPVDAVGQTLLLGESGSGKTHLAQYVHRQLAHRLGRSTAQVLYRQVLLSQKSEDMQKVQLFGTWGSTGRKEGPGVFEEASNRGLVFLDELGNLSATAQGDLLGVLQIQRDAEGRPFRSLTRDSPRPIESRCFILAATNRAWDELRAHLSEALLMRLEQVQVVLPNLRDRREDLPLLLDSFVRASCARYNIQIPEMDVSITAWQDYAEQHSVRQLHDLIESTIKRNPFKTLLIVDDFFRPVAAVGRIPTAIGGVAGDEDDAETAVQVTANGGQGISDLIGMIDTWSPAPSTPLDEFDSSFVRLDTAVARAKLRLWRDLASRHKLVNGSLNLLSTVKRLLGKEDIPKSKPGDLANQVFNEAAILDQPVNDPILSEIWERRRRTKKKAD